MIFGSVCSGIEGASVAWIPIGWKCAWLSEIDPFACSLLAERYPHVPNHGDFTGIDGRHTRVDLLVGGTPCQDFSVTGLRRGLAGERGNLAIEYLKLVDRIRPTWLVWENVAGVLSIDRGRAFGAFLGGLGQLGYGFSYRVLNAEFFGVPQRRRRVFVVGHSGAWRRAAEVLFEPEVLPFDAPEAGKVREKSPRLLRGIAEGRGGVGVRDISSGWTGDETPKCMTGVAPTFRASQGGEGIGVATTSGLLRRLTTRELERLMGFPDGYTDVAHKGHPATETARRTALGNSFAVPVIQWIGRRIELNEIRNITGED